METMTIIKLALFFVSALLLGYLAYRGTRWHLSYLDLEDQLSGFQDKYWSTHSTCPTTGEVCVNTKCAPAILRLYFQMEHCADNIFIIFSFGAYWFASSAAAIILAFRWFEKQSVLISLAYAALPVILCVVLSRVCTPPQKLPEPFSEEIPRMDDIEGFESMIHCYCLRLDSCAEIVGKAASEARLCRTYAAVLSAVMWGIVIATVLLV